jgi:hypothetical protein
MRVPTTEHLYWIIEPLVEAGLEREQIKSLVFHLAFETIVDSGASMTCVSDVVSDHPAQVQAAWSHAIGRMIADEGAAAWP